jgi:hypothetical protein
MQAKFQSQQLINTLMRIHELLLEYDRKTTLQKMGDQLAQTAAREHTTAEAAIAALEEMDPTANKQYTPWLARQYIKQQFRLEDASRIRTVLDNFGQIKSRLPADQRDIGRIDFYQLDDLIDKTLNVELAADTPAETGTFPIVPNSEVLYNGPLGQLAIPKTTKASCELGRGTKWCTAAQRDNQFKDYDGPLYIWRDKNGEKYQFYFSDDSGQMKDSRDRDIEPEKIDYFRKEHPVLKKFFKQIESEVITDPEQANNYAYFVIRGRWPEAEAVIATDPESAASYAGEALKGRWPEAEAVIATDPSASWNYARHAIKGRWPEGEAAIARDPLDSYNYAAYVIKGPFPKGEAAIAKQYETAFNYAYKVLEKRFPRGEAAIARHASNAFYYARDILGDRFPEAEPVIMKDPRIAYNYAYFVIRGRWPEAELKIKQDPNVWRIYKWAFGIK